MFLAAALLAVVSLANAQAPADAPYGVIAKIMSLAEELKINLFLLTTPPVQKTGTRLPESE